MYDSNCKVSAAIYTDDPDTIASALVEAKLINGRNVVVSKYMCVL